MKIDFSAVTDVGKVRKENQDSYGVSRANNLYFVCDGMGGGAAGDFASRAAVEVILKSAEHIKKRDAERILGASADALPETARTPVAAIRLANRALSNFSMNYPKLTGMGTTIAVVWYDHVNNLMHLYHVGDSRIYRLRGGELELLSKDHSKVNELIDQGKMKQEEVKTAEIQSMITRALGTNPKVRIDYRAVQVQADDYFMLCSDGLNGELDDEAIRSIMASNTGDVEAISRQLIGAANTAGGRDNTTVITLRAVSTEYDYARPGDAKESPVVTVGEETAEQSSHEDKVLGPILRAAEIKIPKEARERTFLANPVVLGILITLLIVAAAGVGSRVLNRKGEITVDDLAGKVSGLKVEVRVPNDDQLDNFRRCEDTIEKLQMINDWKQFKDANTTPLKDAEIVLEQQGQEKFRGRSGAVPLDIQVDKGLYSMAVSYGNYRIVTDRMEFKDRENVQVERGEALKPVLLILIPGQH